jgi:protein phosphatase PTC7
LWDNAFEHEIIKSVTTNADAQQAANKLAALARVHASDPEFASPYTREALSQG